MSDIRFSDENPDPYCEEMLAEGDPQELKTWLYGSENTLGIMSTEESVHLADAAYSAGAKAIFAVDIDHYPGDGENTGHLIVELPRAPASRRAVVEWAAPIAHEQGYDAYGDVGQKFIYVKLD